MYVCLLLQHLQYVHVCACMWYDTSMSTMCTCIYEYRTPQVAIVDPLTLTQQFSTILANPIIATNVVTRLILHSGL